MNRTHRYKKWTYQPAANSYGVDKLEHQNILDNPALVSSSRDGNNQLTVYMNQITSYVAPKNGRGTW
jgi:hypothetical protein